MGNTLDQHRAAIGGFAARQVSPNWTPSSSSSLVCQRFERTGEDGGKKRTCVGQLVQLVLLVLVFYSGSLTSQSIDGYVENQNPREMPSFETPTTIVANGCQVSFDYDTRTNLKYNSGEGSPRKIGVHIICRSKFLSR